MSEANAKQMVALVEQSLKNSGNSDLSNFMTPTDQAAILAALQTGNCTAFGTEMAKGYTNTITAGGYNTNILGTFEETERTVLKALYQLPDAIRAILARIRQGNIDKKESVSISDIIHNYEIAFSMGKKKNGVMEYYQPLVLSDGTTTVSAIQLLFSDNIVKVNPVPLPPAIDISLKDKAESNFTISYGLTSNASSNWISITDTKMDEFNALKQYLNPPSYTATFEITGEQLREIFCVDSKGNSIPLEKCKTPSLERCNDIKNLINKYSDKFEINTPLRMAHFLGQIGTETQGLNKLEEVTCFKSKDRIKEIFGTTYYCDLFEGYETSWDECGDGHPKQCTPKLAKITPDLVVKDKYVCSPLLIDYTYSCRMGNGTPASGDGSKFLGKGFIHLTGKGQFENISNLWNADNANNKKDFAGKDINEITDNIDVAMKASMYYWINIKNVGVNKVIKKGSGNDFADNDDQIFLNQFVNGGQNGANLRKKYKDNALKILKR